MIVYYPMIFILHTYAASVLIMTGSLFLNRQHSSTASFPSKNKTARRKLRRCSSADEQSSFEIMSDENQTKEKLSTKFDPTSSDNDSGIEDFEQQNVNSVREQTNNVEEEEESSPCFGACEDENVEDDSTPTDNQQFQYPEQQDLQDNFNILNLAAQIPHENKKEFCLNTCEVFHGEFARLIAVPISMNYPGLNYYLFVEDGVGSDPRGWPNFAYMKLDNAKGQFKCPNPKCRRLWTSMRARISFAISYPGPQGFVVLKIYGQNCQSCETPADALWYMEEVCRVMENLSQSIFQAFFPTEMTYNYSLDTEMIGTTSKYSQRSRHDPHQRKGMAKAPHDQTHCEACRRGLCFN